MRLACCKLRRLGRAIAPGTLMVAAGLTFGTTPAMAQTVPCHSIDLQVGIAQPSERTCASGTIAEDDFRSTWELVEVNGDPVYAFVIRQVGGTRSGFYRSRLEPVIESLLEEGGDIEWAGEVEDDRFEVRRLYLLRRGGELPCIGFQRQSGSLNGSDIKSVIYGYICNTDGAEFFDADITEMLAKIRA